LLLDCIKDWLFNHIKTDIIKLNYIGFGSANNAKQQFPHFLLDHIYNQNIRVILIDPLMETELNFIKNVNDSYLLNEREYELNEINNFIKIYKVKSLDNYFIEIISIKCDSEHRLYKNKDLNFYKKIISLIIKQDGLLIGYDYSGYSMSYVDKYFQNIMSDKYLDHILLDMSYGKDLGCFPDLKEIYPIINNNKIINLTFRDINKYKEYINETFKILVDDKLFKKHIIDTINIIFYNFKNIDHPKYRILYDKKDSEFHKITEYIYKFFSTLYDTFDIKLDNKTFLEDIKTGNKYTCFNKYFNEINNHINLLFNV